MEKKATKRRPGSSKESIAPNIPMANIKEFQRDVVKIDYGEFRGGTKFRNGDTLLAKEYSMFRKWENSIRQLSSRG